MVSVLVQRYQETWKRELGDKMFNLWSGIKKSFGSVKTASREQDLEKQRDEGGLEPLDGGSLPYALSESHGDEPDMSVASMLDVDRADSPDQTAESRLSSESSGGLVLSARQGRETSSISDINLASEGWDSKFREAYAAAQRGERDMFSLHFDPSDFRVDSVAQEDSGLQNRAGRVSNYGNVPFGDAKTNIKNIGKSPSVKTAGNDLLDIDRRCFEIHLAAAVDQRRLQDHESAELSELKSRKRDIVKSCISGRGGR
jgi:hypothetical protein